MEIQRIRSGGANCWLVCWGGRTLLIDAGTLTDHGFIRRLSRFTDPRSIELLVLTHGHSGHVGNAAALRTQFGIPIALASEDLPLVQTALPQSHSALPTSVRRLIYPHPRRQLQFTPDFELPRGLPPSVRYIPCPGHTSGSAALLIGDALFAGDAVNGGLNPSLPRSAENPEQAAAALFNLTHLRCRTVYPGHGRPFSVEALHRIALRQHRLPL